MIDLSSVDVIDLLDKRLGMANVRLTSGGREANFSCPKPGHAHGDERPSAYMNTETTFWWCFGCHSKGTAVSFVSETLSLSTTDAQKWLRDTYGIEFIEPQDGSMIGEVERRLKPPPPLPIQTRPSKSWLSMLQLSWEHPERYEPYQRYMIERGFIPDTLINFEIGYDYTCGRLTFPVYDLEGELVGIKGRSWDGREPKYLVLGDRGESTKFGFHPYQASEVVFGLNRHRGLKTAIVFEGEFNAMACEQALIDQRRRADARSVAIGMSYMSKRHADLLAREVDNIFLFGDPDAAGSDFVKGHVSSSGQRQPGAVALLESRVNVWVVEGHDCDAAELVRLGRSSEIIELLDSARSSLAFSTVSR